MKESKWDGVSYCVNQDGNQAVIKDVVGMVGDSPVFEMICLPCALKSYFRSFVHESN